MATFNDIVNSQAVKAPAKSFNRNPEYLRLKQIKVKLVEKLNKNATFVQWNALSKEPYNFDDVDALRTRRDLSQSLFDKLNKLKTFQYFLNIDYTLSKTPLKGEEKPKPVQQVPIQKKKVFITRKPLQERLVNSFINPSIPATRGDLYNPITFQFVKNNTKNRASVVKQINQYNDKIFNALYNHISTTNNKHGLQNFFNSHEYHNKTNAPKFEFIDEPKYKTWNIIERLLKRYLQEQNGNKVYVSFYCLFKKFSGKNTNNPNDTNDETNYEYETLNINFPTTTLNNTNDITKFIDTLERGIHDRIYNPDSKLKGSGWLFERIEYIQVNLIHYTPTVAMSYIPTPKKLALKKAIENTRNEDNECFKWACMASLHPQGKNGERISKYKEYVKLYNWNDITFPTSIDNIETFETNNNLSINVYKYDELNENVIPLRLSKVLTPKHITENTHINLLIIQNDEKLHYTSIKTYSRLFSNQLTNHHGTIYPCYYCNKACTSKEVLSRHIETCQQLTTHKEGSIKMPEKGQKLFFKNYNNKFKAPFVLVVDFEAILPSNKTEKNMQNIHLPCSFGVNMITDFEEHRQAPTFYLGNNENDTMDKFYNVMESYTQYIFKVLKKEVKMKTLTPEEQHSFNTATHCHICDTAYTPGQKRVRDHCHITGNFRGSAHEDCNINFNYKNYKVPVVIHNLKNYDAHFIIKYYKHKTYQKYNKKTKQMEEKEIPITVIANNEEKYMSFTIGRLKFIDSFQFLSSSLDALVDNLKKDGLNDFKYTKRYMGEKWEMACEKGIYPYEYMDNFNRFNETQLPPREAFYSKLKLSGISEKEYEKAQIVWQQLEMKTMKDYHDFYLKCDIFLLSDVFDTFRNAMLKTHKLDPAHYITLPSFSWDASLKYSKIELELLTDYEMLCMMERGIRGGISVITQRYAEANNKYMSDYDDTKPSKYIIYEDANNLYGVAMCLPLPYQNFEWTDLATFPSVSNINNNPAIMNRNIDMGYTLEVDLEYPEELHNLHNDYPLAPDSVLVSNDMLGDWQTYHAELLNIKEDKTKKLCPNLNNKSKYVVHSQNLQYYLEKGMKLTKIHRVIQFNQKAWLSGYINANTDLRKKATTDFEKDLYKLLNNSVFGKTMENIRGRIEYEIVQTRKRAQTITQSPKFKSFTIINNEMVGVQSHKKETFFNKPIYCGQAILDLSKLHMYRYHYDNIKATYGDKAKLLFTDTDSLTYEIETQDLYKDMQAHKDLYDFSAYPSDHFLYDTTNKKIQGKFKDETNGIPIIRFVAPATKMYSIALEPTEVNKRNKIIQEKNIKIVNEKDRIDEIKLFKGTAKGISKSYMKKNVKHDNYIQCVLGQQINNYDVPTEQQYLNNIKQRTSNMYQFKSSAHQIGTYEIVKDSLKNYDNKRFILDDGIHTLAHGHKDTRNYVANKQWLVEMKKL